MSDDRELVSIVVPVYNAGKYIENTIRMVEDQTFENWELVLVDDCSSDNSRAVIREYLAARPEAAGEAKAPKGAIRLIEKEKNQGAAMARNTGVDAARGRYIAFLDADDVWLPQKLEKELEFMKRSRAAFVFTSYEFGDEKAEGTGRIVHAPELLTYRRALSRTVIFTSTVLLDTQRLCGAGKDLIHMPVVESEDTACHLPQAGGISVLQQAEGHKKNLESVPESGGIIPFFQCVSFCFLGVSRHGKENIKIRTEVYK